MSRRHSQPHNKRETHKALFRPSILIDSEDKIPDKSRIFGCLPELKAIKERIAKDGLTGDPVPCLLRRLSEIGNQYWLRAYGVSLGHGYFRVYILRKNGIYSPSWWKAIWSGKTVNT